MANGRLSTIQKRARLNDVIRLGEPGPGGAYHDYEIWDGDYVTTAYPRFVCEVKFQKGPRKEYSSRHGVLDQDLLEIVRDRLTCFQAGEFATRENEMALQHIEEALLWLNKRVEDRIERNVLGTYDK